MVSYCLFRVLVEKPVVEEVAILVILLSRFRSCWYETPWVSIPTKPILTPI